MAEVSVTTRTGKERRLVESICEAEGWKIEQGSSQWQQLLRWLGRGQIEANDWLAADLNGDARTIQGARFASEQYRLDEQRLAERRVCAPVPITEMLVRVEKRLQP